LPQLAAISLGSVSIVLFAVVTGAGATIVRASIMALLVLLARATGRVYEITIALFTAGFLMLLHNPKILVFDPSFQLSFLATFGLVYLAPLVERRLGFLPSKWHIREVTTATIATQAFVLPLLLYKVGELSLVALPVNLLILLVVPLTMLFGFLAGAIGFLSFFASLPFAWIAYAFLAYQLGVVRIFSFLPFASVHIPFPLLLLVAFYLFYGVVIYKFSAFTAGVCRGPDSGLSKSAEFTIID
jgi:competence protein ComEC